MRTLPDTVVRVPGDRGGIAYLLWLARRQWTTMLLGVGFDLIWLLGLAVTPWAVGRAIDDGILGRNVDAVLGWATVLLIVALLRAFAEAMRNRAGISNWNTAAFRSAQLLGHHLTRTGEQLRRTHSVGEVLAVQGDAFTLARVFFLLGGLTSAIASYVVVAVIVLNTSPPLGVFVLIGVPIFGVALSLLAKPLHRRQQDQREAAGAMTDVAADAVAGLRVLRGIGGERQFLARYRQASAVTLRTGRALARPVAVLEGLQVLLGGVLIVVLTSAGGLLVVSGDLRPGELVTFFGYAGFLLTPVNLVADNLTTLVPAVIGARRLTAVLGVQRPRTEGRTISGPPTGSRITDELTGIELSSGRVIGLVSYENAKARELFGRLTRSGSASSTPAQIRWGGVDLERLSLAELRTRILLVDALPHLYAG
ncbi:MAG: ABC transporter ATP-binding protein, partial [Propionibacteriales bacterium]|nr:ABC transporter ATP-binding protein [Propionibacteriales bacterium]